MELEVRIARALDELEEIYHLRYQIYSQVGYIKKEDYPDEKETDEFDEFSTHFYAFNLIEKRIVGAIRLIKDTGKLPIEDIYDISFLRKQNKKIVEVSRRVTLPNRIKANFGLLQIIFQYAGKNNITNFICSINPKDIDFYLKLGFNQFGSLKHYDKMRMPALGMHLEIAKLKPPYSYTLYKPSKDIIF